MVGPIKKGGKYSRGRIRGREKPYHSKYSVKRDRLHSSKAKVVGGKRYRKMHKPGRVGSGAYRHTHD